MGLFRFFSRNASPDCFARMLIDRLRAAGDTREIEYDPKTFSLSTPGANAVTYLGNVFAEYQRAGRDEREQVVRIFQTTWFTAGIELPEEFEDVRPDLLAAVRSRAYFEVGVPLMALESKSRPGFGDLSYTEIADCLTVAPVYDLPTSIRQLGGEDLDRWGVSIYEALEVAKQNLHEMTREVAQLDDVYCFSSGDSHDAARLLLTELIGSLDVRGETIAMAPNREMLLVTGSESPGGLKQMAQLAVQGMQHERWISGVALRLREGAWEQWLPPAEHPERPAFDMLRVQTLMAEYEQQKTLLDQRHEQEGREVFVATYSATRDEATGRVRSYCMWGEGIETLLPRTDRVVLMASDDQERPAHIAAASDWETVAAVAGDLLTLEDLYPERRRVSGFPTAEQLAEIGVAEWARK